MTHVKVWLFWHVPGRFASAGKKENAMTILPRVRWLHMSLLMLIAALLLAACGSNAAPAASTGSTAAPASGGAVATAAPAGAAATAAPAAETAAAPTPSPTPGVVS